MNLTADQIIRRPLTLTEKARNAQLLNNQIVFEVALDANKIQIRSAVESLFGVKVSSVNTLVQRGKVKRVGRRELKRPNWKKAVVTLAAGDSIEFFDESEA